MRCELKLAYNMIDEQLLFSVQLSLKAKILPLLAIIIQ